MSVVPGNAPASIKDLFGPVYRESLFSAFGLLIAAYVFEHFANVYAFEYMSRPTSTHVGDVFLETLPLVDLNFLIVEVALISIVCGVLFTLSRPRHLLFALKALSLFIIIRAFFISLTHMGIYPEHINPGLGFFDSLYTYLNFQTGFFFSGHTGLPFLMALVFWRDFFVRITFLTLSFVLGAAVLFAHVHYSIDVFAAPFMAYGIFKIAAELFPRDYKFIETALST